MSTATINPVDRLRELGGELFLEGDKIGYRIPVNNPEVSQLLDEIRRDRDEVIRILRERQACAELAEAGQDGGSYEKPCYACGSRLFWRSVYGAIVCFNCHPPANERLVASLLYDGQVKWKM